MKTGRPATPTAIRLLKGNPQHRPINDQEPKPKPVAPKCPTFLSLIAKLHWGYLARRLEPLGLLTELDVGALAGVCQAWAQYREATEFMIKHGSVYRTPGGVLTQVPQVSIARAALAAYMKGCAEFGLSPQSRTHIKVQPAGEDDEDDLLDELDKPHWARP